VVGSAESEATGESLDRAFELRVCEGDKLAAPFADEVMVMVLTCRVGRLVPGDAVAEVETVDEVVVVQELEDPVDARPANDSLAAPPASQRILELDGAERAVLAGQQIDQPVAGRAAVVSGPAQHRARMLAPCIAGGSGVGA